jgi:hypothetical protein
VKLGTTGETSANVQSDSVYGFILKGNPYTTASSTLRGVSGVFTRYPIGFSPYRNRSTPVGGTEEIGPCARQVLESDTGEDLEECLNLNRLERVA